MKRKFFVIANNALPTIPEICHRNCRCQKCKNIKRKSSKSSNKKPFPKFNPQIFNVKYEFVPIEFPNYLQPADLRTFTVDALNEAIRVSMSITKNRSNE